VEVVTMAGELQLGEVAAMAGKLRLREVAAADDVLGRLSSERRLRLREEDNVMGKNENKKDDRWAPLMATVNGVKMSSIPSLSTFAT
jgi:hypothetical protein